MLLTREQFNDAVMTRDEYKCVVCGDAAVDAHHLLDRKLFPDGGYYLDNGVSLCERDHWRAETTEVSADQLRAFAGITNVVLPPDWDAAKTFDKWGNEMRSDGTRSVGPLMHDTGAMRALRRIRGMIY